VPESHPSSRSTQSGSTLARLSDEGGSRALRLAVVASLPARHQKYLFEKVQSLCAGWLRRNRISVSEVSADELASEIWMKLVAFISTTDDPFCEPFDANPDDWSADTNNPESDGRVIWLIAEIGGSLAIGHRYEDLRRRRHGRKGELVQSDGEGGLRETAGESDGPTEAQRKEDAQRVWRGLLITAADEFRPGEDVSLLLKLLADQPDILDDSSGGQWPVRRIVALLSNRPPPRSWSEDQVDNAKRRLLNWVTRLMRKNRLDSTDLEGLFAAVARNTEIGKTEPPGDGPHRVLN
jgi:hypothetical protein